MATAPAPVAAPVGTGPAAPGRSGNPALIGTLALAGAAAMFMVGLGAAYMSVRNANTDFIPTGFRFNNYTAGVITGTVLIASMAAVWANQATRIGHKRYTNMAWLLTMGMGVAALNLIWFLGRSSGLGVADGPYALIFYALLVGAGTIVAIATVTVALAAARSASGQISAGEPHLGIAASWSVHVATAAWIAVHAIIYLYK